MKKAIAKRTHAIPAAVLALLALVTIGCGQDLHREKLVITGGSTLVAMLQSAAEELEAVHSNLQVVVQPGGSTKGIRDTIAGNNHLGSVARDLSDDEKEQVLFYPVAQDGVALIVNSRNPLSELTSAQLKLIYTKEVSSWREFTSFDAPIRIVHKASGHATRRVFLDFTQLDAADVKPDVVAGNNSQVVTTVAQLENSIGYVSIADAKAAIDIGTAIKFVALDGTEPTLKNVEKGDYPITRTLYLVSKEEPTGWAKVMLDYLKSEPGKAIIEESNYVPAK